MAQEGGCSRNRAHRAGYQINNNNNNNNNNNTYLTSKMCDYDVIVVGGGVAGLQAAREISKRAPHLKLKVLEATDRVGGRTRTVSLRTAGGSTDQWDLGGQWVGESQTDLLNLMKELNIEMYPQYVTGTKLSQMGGTKIRPYSDTQIGQAFLNFSLLEGYDFLQALHRIEDKAKTLDFADPFTDASAVDLDSQTLQSWCQSHSHSRTLPDALDIAANVVFGTHANRLSLLYVMLYGRAADGSFLNTLEAEGKRAANSFKIKGGAEQLCRMMSADLGGAGVVELDCAVRRCDNGQQRVTLTCQHNQQLTKLTAQRVIFAIPPQQCARIEFQPSMPDDKHQLFTNCPMGNLIKFILTYRRPFWRERDLSGEIISTGITDVPGEKRRPVMVTFDATTHRGNAALVGFINNEWAHGTSTQERRDAVLDDLARFFGDEAKDFIDYEDLIWSTVPYTGGCPVAVVPPGCTQWYTRCREPVSRLHFAGTETATHWPGYMTGACQSGLRAAHEILWHLASDKADPDRLKDSVYAPDYRSPVEPDVSYDRVSSGSRWWGRLKRVAAVALLLAAGWAIGKRRLKLHL